MLFIVSFLFWLLKLWIWTDKYHGVILLPEGLIESIPEVYALLKVFNANAMNLFVDVSLQVFWKFLPYLEHFVLWLLIKLSFHFCSYRLLTLFSFVPFRKFMVWLGKVFLLIIFLLNFHLGLLLCLSFYHPLSRNRFQYSTQLIFMFIVTSLDWIPLNLWCLFLGYSCSFTLNRMTLHSYPRYLSFRYTMQWGVTILSGS